MDRIGEKRVLFHKLLYKIGALECKNSILLQYGVVSTTELTEKQLDEIIKNLGASLSQDNDTVMRKWRSTALALMNKCGVYVTNNDWSHVNRFMANPRICGKQLKECTLDDLQNLCKKLRAIAQKKEEMDTLNMVNNFNLN